MEEMAINLMVEINNFNKSTKNINFDYKKCIVLKAPFIREGYNWLLKINNNEGLKLIKIRSLCTQDQWKKYKMFGDCSEQFREVKMLREAQDNLYTAIRSQKRPKFFKKTRREAMIKRIEGKKKND